MIMGIVGELNFERIYIFASLVVAVLIWLENRWILQNDGKLPQFGAFVIVSLITSSWLVVSGLALFFLDFNNLQMSVPASYGVYFLASWIYGSRVISLADIDDPMDLVMPKKYLDFCSGFSLAFLALCAFVVFAPLVGYK